MRNTKVIDVIAELEEYGVNVKVVDPVADAEDLLYSYGITLTEQEDIKDVDAVVFAVAHDEFKSISLADVKKLYNGNRNSVYTSEAATTSEMDIESTKEVLVDVKGLFNRKEAEELNYLYWRL